MFFKLQVNILMSKVLNMPVVSDNNSIGRLDIQLLKSFLEISRSPTLSSAAEKLKIPQPTMSLQMKRLEARAGKLLFELGRRGKPLRLTVHGERLVRHAERIIDAYEDTVNFLGMPELSGSLRLGIPDIISDTGLRDILSRFKAIYEDVDLTIVPASVEKIKEMVADGSIDASISLDINDSNKVRVLWSESYHWVCAKDKAVLFQDPLPVALVSDRDPLRDTISERLNKKGQQWVEAYTSDSMAKIYASCAGGQTVAAVAASLINSDVTIVDGEKNLGELPDRTFAIYQSPSASKDNNAERLIHAMGEFVSLKMQKLNEIAIFMVG